MFNSIETHHSRSSLRRQDGIQRVFPLGVYIVPVCRNSVRTYVRTDPHRTNDPCQPSPALLQMLSTSQEFEGPPVVLFVCKTSDFKTGYTDIYKNKHEGKTKIKNKGDN